MRFFFIGFLFFSVWFFAFRKFSGCIGLRAYVFKLPILKAQHRIKKPFYPFSADKRAIFHVTFSLISVDLPS